MTTQSSNLTRIGVFYDGNYFAKVSTYYNYIHYRKSRISISGLHHYIRQKVAEMENTDARLSQIVDAHYFRGRLNASDARAQGDLHYYDRVLDDILSSEGVTTHYLPLLYLPSGDRYEKGIDVWLALEAFEQAFYKRFDVVVLIASDGDYVPLARKLNTLGTRVMVLGWNFQYKYKGELMETKTSQQLLEEVTYPVLVHEEIDHRVHRHSPQINNMFLPSREFNKRGSDEEAPEAALLLSKQRPAKVSPTPSASRTTEAAVPAKSQLPDPETDSELNRIRRAVEVQGKQAGRVITKNNSFGFIQATPANMFFFHNYVEDDAFPDLQIGDIVSYKIGYNKDNQEMAVEVRLEEVRGDMEF